MRPSKPWNRNRWLCRSLALAGILAASGARPVVAQDVIVPPEGSSEWEAQHAPATQQRLRPEATPATPEPFGARLFEGNFMKQSSDGLNPEYVVAPGDRVAVNTWGSVEINDVFIVDGQGNIFLPQIGPIHLAGVRNADLTTVVKSRIRAVFLRNFGVYTNLLRATPVAVFVTGEVQHPGRYAGLPSDSPLFFIDQAGGMDPDTGSYRRIALLRNGELLAEVDLYDFLLEGKMAHFQLADGDTLLVQRRGPTITLLGDVARPTLVESDAPTFSGEEALRIIPTAARATEVTVTGMRDGVPVARTMSVNAFATFALADGDVVHIRSEGHAETLLVQLEGEFKGPAVLSVKRGARLLDLLNHVEVNPQIANTDAVHLKRVSVAQAQKKAIDDSLFRLERTALLTLSQSNGEADIRVKEAQLMESFVERARLIQPLGRVVTAQNGRQLNVLLEDGDIVVIPTRSNVVHVAGEVQMTQAIAFRPGLTAGDYIRLAGGYTDRGDDDRVLVMHPSAEVTLGDSGLPVNQGDEVIVPPRVDPKRLQNTMDVVQVVYQIAVAAGVALSPVLAATR